MAVKTFTTEVLTSADTNTYLANSGLVYISQTTFAASSNAVVSNVFSSTYTNYRIVTNLTQGLTSAAMLRLQFTIAGTATASSYLAKVLFYDTNGATVGFTGQDNQSTVMPLGHIGSVNTSGHQGAFDVFRPYATSGQYKAIKGDSMGLADGAYFTGSIFAGSFSNASAHDGFKLSCSNSATISGTVYVYGYRQA